MSELRRQDRKGDIVRAAWVAGLIGGGAFALIMVMPVAGNLPAAWPNLKVPAYPFLGPQAFHPMFDLGALALGTVAHFAVSIAWALLFCAVTVSWSRPAILLSSLPFGALVWFVMNILVVPLVGASAVMRPLPVTIAIVQHLAFGLAVGLTVALLRPQSWGSRRAVA